MRRIAGVKRIDKRRMGQLRDEVGERENLTKMLARSRLVDRTCGEDGRGRIDEESGCV